MVYQFYNLSWVYFTLKIFLSPYIGLQFSLLILVWCLIYSDPTMTHNQHFWQGVFITISKQTLKNNDCPQIIYNFLKLEVLVYVYSTIVWSLMDKFQNFSEPQVLFFVFVLICKTELPLLTQVLYRVFIKAEHDNMALIFNCQALFDHKRLSGSNNDFDFVVTKY